jgi:GntR family colanic acid and biofilm gene transcriptional regulator
MFVIWSHGTGFIMRRLIEPELAEKAVLKMDANGFEECLSLCQKLRSAYERRDVYLAHPAKRSLCG